MNQIQAVIEHIADGGIGEGDTRQFAVDRIQNAHPVSTGEAPEELPAGKERHGREGQEDADDGDDIGMHTCSGQGRYQ